MGDQNWGHRSCSRVQDRHRSSRRDQPGCWTAWSHRRQRLLTLRERNSRREAADRALNFAALRCLARAPKIKAADEATDEDRKNEIGLLGPVDNYVVAIAAVDDPHDSRTLLDLYEQTAPDLIGQQTENLKPVIEALAAPRRAHGYRFGELSDVETVLAFSDEPSGTQRGPRAVLAVFRGTDPARSEPRTEPQKCVISRHLGAGTVGALLGHRHPLVWR
jgi:nucleotide-binding universal stress UspA family protein